MAAQAAMMLFDPIRSGFKNEINYVHQLKSKPGSLARIKDIKDIPGGFAAFGRGFVGIDDSRQPNNNHSRRAPRPRAAAI